MKYAQLVMGPAGTGKSTYCKTLVDHCATKKRTVRVVNLDPAAENFYYPVSIGACCYYYPSCHDTELLTDIRDLISVGDAMEGGSFGPNGGLVFCME